VCRDAQPYLADYSSAARSRALREKTFPAEPDILARRIFLPNTDNDMPISRTARIGLAAFLALTCVACATPSTQTASEPQEDKIYRTGSRIPVKDPESSSSKSIDVQSVQDSMRTSGSRAITPQGK
jgi:hypothetical protein